MPNDFKPSSSEFLMISKKQSFPKRSEPSFKIPSTFPATVTLRRPLPISAATSSIETDELKVLLELSGSVIVTINVTYTRGLNKIINKISR